MNKLYERIGKLIEKSPFKVLFASLIIGAILISGAVKVNMATGNDTLVQSDSEAYISNYEMEEEFGADAIMVLLKGRQEDLLSQKNIEKMWNVEQRLKHNDDIYSFLSSASIIHQMTDKQGEKMKENLPEISDGLDEMSKKFIEIGTELAGKDVPDPDEIESKLDNLMANIDLDSFMGDLLEQQESEIAKMTKDLGKMSGGLTEMGNNLTTIGSELGSKDVPNPKEIEKKLDQLMVNMNPDKLVEEMFAGQEAEMAEMEEKVGKMSSRLNEMGDGLVMIGKNIGSMDSPDMGNIEEKLNDLEGISKMFNDLIKGQDNLDQGITGLAGGLSESSEGITTMASQLEQMAEQAENTELKKQLVQTSKKLKESSNALRTIAENTDQLKEVPTNTSDALTEIQANLVKEINEMKNTLPEGMPAGELEEISIRLTEMGQGLNTMGDKISSLPEEIGRSLGNAPSKMLNDLMENMEREVAKMKVNISGGISPKELNSMASGFTTMGSKLTEMSGGLSNLPDKMGEALTGAQDPSSQFTDMMAEIEAEVEEMKVNLSGGIDPDELKTMADGFVTMGENLTDLSEALETFVEKSGMMVANIPHNQDELDFILYDDDGELKDIFSDTIIDDQHLMMMIKLEGNIEDTVKDEVYVEVKQAMEAENFGKEADDNLTKGNSPKVYAMGEELKDGEIEYLISGKPVLDASLREEMQVNMKYMVVAAAIVMTLVLFFIFKVRWGTFSIGIILVAVIGTLGLMGHLGVSMTMVSMAVFPILIGLGIDFSIQFHNRYEEELSVTTSLTQTGRAIAMAVLASMLGFISLYVSPVPMIQDFGKMLTIGVVVSFLVSIFLLMPILRIRDLYNPVSKHIKSDTKSSSDAEYDGGILGRILSRTTKWVSRFAPIVLIIAIVLASLGLFGDSKVGVETDIETFMPQDMKALEDIRYVRDVVGSTDQIVLYMKDENILSESNISWIQDKEDYISNQYSAEIEDVKSIDSLVANISEGEDLSYQEYIDLLDDLPGSQRSMFVSEDMTKGSMILNIKHMDTEKLEKFISDLDKDLEDAPMDLTVTGNSVLDVEMVEGLTGGRMKMTFLGIALVFLGIFLIYRNPIKALIPILPVVLIVGMSGGVMYLLGFNYTPITATLGALVLGMGTETTIMVLDRYVEEREKGKNKTEALNITITRIGKATLSTEFTTMGGFAVLVFSNFVILKDFGIMTVINVSLIMISTFVVLPAVIWMLDRFIIKE
ncbi:MAG: hydrophobe/amphiphile efflux-3 (HAE3) family transporter [Tissierella sp.]|uniref:efflux RND transporter permease subunit n=1 Tax=Tissierella sp. TaxID=41274 RepID=UPI003F96AB9E